jgi:hypothetical protein
MKTNNLKHSITVISAKEKTLIKIHLNDECKNGHEDFSITADVWDKAANGNWRESMGGCCHEHILSLRPKLKPFVDLHLSTFEGVPMHAMSNAWYWFQGAFPESADCSNVNLGPCHGGTGSGAKSPAECRAIFAEHIRATPEQVEAIAATNPRTQQELQAVIEDMGLPAQWKQEADAAIKQMEEWTGQTFESQATRGRFEPLSAEVKQIIAERRANGYYSPENVAARDAQAKADRKAVKLAEIKKDLEINCAKLRAEYDGKKWLLEHDQDLSNWIYYTHTKTFCLGWRNPAKEHEVSSFLDIASEFPYNYEIKCADGRKLSN